MNLKSDKKLQLLRMMEGTNKVDIRFTVEDVRELKEEELGALIKNHLQQEVTFSEQSYPTHLQWLRYLKDEQETYETIFKPLILSLLSEQKQKDMYEQILHANRLSKTDDAQAKQMRRDVRHELYNLLYPHTRDHRSPSYHENPEEIITLFLKDIVI